MLLLLSVRQKGQYIVKKKTNSLESKLEKLRYSIY